MWQKKLDHILSECKYSTWTVQNFPGDKKNIHISDSNAELLYCFYYRFMYVYK